MVEDLESDQHRHVSRAVSPSILRDANECGGSVRDVSVRTEGTLGPARVCVLSVAHQSSRLEPTRTCNRPSGCLSDHLCTL